MGASIDSQRCSRARQWISLEVDGELSRFEQALLRDHLRGCDCCRVFQADVGTVSRELRQARLEALLQPVALPAARRHARSRPLQALAAAALSVAALGIATTVGVLHGSPQRPEARSTRPAYLDSWDYERSLIRQEMLRAQQYGRAI